MGNRKILEIGMFLGLALALLLNTRVNGETNLAGPSVRFVNNGDGTISDLQTGLMWEVKDDSGGLHDKDHTYTWSSTAPNPDGTLFSRFLADINTKIKSPAATKAPSKLDLGGCTDWRVPTITELQTLRDTNCQSGPPCVIDPIFHTNCMPGCMSVMFDPTQACSCTVATDYWSSTSFSPRRAWGVGFDTGSLITSSKTFVRYVRAVRDSQRGEK